MEPASVAGFLSRSDIDGGDINAENTAYGTVVYMATATQKHDTIKPELKAFIAHSIREILDDPDYGLELKESFKKKLRVAQKSKGKGIPLAEIRKKYY